MKDKLSCMYRVVSSVFLLLFLTLIIPTKTLAVTTKSYYDWGPYYQSQQVLGLTISSLEELPIPALPPDTAIPPATGILPGNPLSPFEHLVENIQLTFIFNPVQKEQFRLSLAEERLSEAKTLVDQGRYQYAAQAAVSYQQTMGVVADNLQNLAVSNPDAANQLAAAVEEKAASSAVIAQAVTIAAPPAATATWTYITEGVEEALDAVSDVQNQPPIPDNLSAGIQSLKAQGLLTPEESEKIYGLTSRAEVRNQLEQLATSGRFPIAEVAKLDTAVAARYPDFHNQIENTLQFAELRTYEAYPPLTAEVKTSVDQWQSRTNKDLPPPPEIRAYLYSLRAEELARTVDLAPFSADQQNEVVKFFPEAVNNPSLPFPIPTPQVTPSPAPSPEGSAQPEATPVTSPSPSPFPVNPYITEYDGVLPGDPFYFFKQAGEGLQTVTTFGGKQRAELQIRFAQERLREATVLARDQARADDYQQTLEQYRNAMRSVVQAVKTLGGPEDQKQELARTLESEASRHNIIFEKGLLPVPTENTQIFTDAVGATENLMDVSADTLGRAPLPPALTNRLQDLKAQGLLLSEEVEILIQAESREAVREKIQDLIDAGTFPPADAKKLDENQAISSPGEFNQLVEVRKVEELQRLRSVQAEFAQTATLRATKAGYETQSQTLSQNIDPSIIKPEDLAGREELLRVYEKISKNASARPINSGQFGKEATPGATLSTPQVSLRTLATGACPAGASFREGEGCVWNDNNRRIDDYEQYRCGLGQYWSFVTKSCVSSNEVESGRPGDVSPLCPAGYTWSWELKVCTLGRGTLPTPSPEPEPRDDQEREERAKACPEGSTYKVPRGCVWDDTNRSINDPNQYRCASGQYYSFNQRSCVSNPPPGTPYPEEDVRPNCQEEREYFSWESGKCVTQPEPYVPSPIADLVVPQPTFASSDSPLYFLKRGFEAVQGVTAFTAEARERVRLTQARERFAESYDQLEKNNDDRFKTALAEYTVRMQDVYNDLAENPSLSDSARKTLGDVLATQAVEQNLLLQKATVIASPELATAISSAVSVTIQGVDRAADLQGEQPIPDNVREKIAALPDDMIAPDEKQKILDIDNRVEARLKLGDLVGQGILAQTDTAVFNAELAQADPAALIKITELQKLNQVATLEDQTKQITKRVEKTEDVAKKLDEFRQTFEPGQEIPAEIRPYVRLTRIDEVTSTIRPDIIRLDDFGNRKDVQLAIATLQEEFKPTRGSVQRVEQYRRNNPGRALPFDLARVEALYLGLGVRDNATSCFLPSPPFAPNTPCPPPGAAIPVSNYVYGSGDYAVIGDAIVPKGFLLTNTIGTDGKPLVYGQGPEATSAGVCPNSFHWMYDSGGWCMSNSGNYSSNTSYSTPYPSDPGYTPYTPYYSAPGSQNYGYQGPGGYSNFINTYSPPDYYGVAPTYYTTNPPPGTVPGSGPAPVSSGECPSGFHWMPPSYNQAGWCMSNGGTYVPSGSGGSGSVVPPSSCPPTYYWSSASNSCVPAPSYSGTYPGGNYNYYSPNLTQSSCGPGYYWDGTGCIPTYSGSGSSGGASPSNYCQGLSCGGGSYLDYSTCSCRYSSTSGGGTSSGSGTSGCYPPSGGCGSGYFDYGSCSCREASSQGCYNVSASSCGSGFYWDSGACTCRSTSDTSTSGSGGSSTPTSGGSTPSSGSCPSGYHWMSDNGGWCMSDGTQTGSTSTSPTTSDSTTTSPTTSEPAPAPTSSEPAPVPPPSEPAPTTSP